LGQYSASSHFTIGQGAKISGASQKWFIAKKDRVKNTVFVCGDTNHPALYSDTLYVKVEDFNWILGIAPKPLMQVGHIRAFCRIRHLKPLEPCLLSWNKSESIIVVQFDRALRAITPGQTTAIYVGKDGLICLGGGPILMHGPTCYDLGLSVSETLPLTLQSNNQIL